MTYQFVLLIASSVKKWREGGVGKSERGNSAKRFTGPEFWQWMNTHKHTRTHTDRQTHTHTYTHTHTHTRIYTHVHTHRDACALEMWDLPKRLPFHSLSSSSSFNSTHLCRLLQWLSLGAFMYKRDSSLLRCLYFIYSFFLSFFRLTFVPYPSCFFSLQKSLLTSLSVCILSSFRQTVTHSVSPEFSYSRKFQRVKKTGSYPLYYDS